MFCAIEEEWAHCLSLQWGGGSGRSVEKKQSDDYAVDSPENEQAIDELERYFERYM